MNTRRNMIFMTNTTRMEEARSTVDGMKNTRARRVAMKRKGLCIRDIMRLLFIKIIIKYYKIIIFFAIETFTMLYTHTLIRPLKLRFCFYFRVIMVGQRNMREVIIIMRRKVINRQRDTTVIMIMMRNMAIKKDMRQGINGQNQIIIIDETRQNSHNHLHNRPLCFIYICFIENFSNKSKLYIWNSIECQCIELERLMITMIILFLSSKRHTNLSLDFHNYL